MAELKTQKNDASVTAFIASLKDPAQQKDARAMLALMRRATGTTPKMWGSSIIGFGDLHYRYPSGRELDWFVTGFSPRAGKLTVYLMAGFEAVAPLFAKLGKHAAGKGCLYVPRLSDVDPTVLEDIVRRSVGAAVRAAKATRGAKAPAKKRAAAPKKKTAAAKRAGAPRTKR